MAEESVTREQQEAEEMAELAGLKCPTCEGLTFDTPDCQGTHRRFPGLSRECPGKDGYICVLKGSRNHPLIEDTWSCLCHGTGRIPVSVAEGFLWLVGQESGWRIDSGKGGIVTVWWPSSRVQQYAHVGQGPTAPLALFAAVMAAVEAEHD